jgi:Xaa-Pro aminopeptidase
MIFKSKIDEAKELMKTAKFDVWVTISRESGINTDPVLPVISNMYFSRTAAILIDNQGKSKILLSKIDASGARQRKLYDEIYDYDSNNYYDFDEKLLELIGNNKTIGLNYSENDPMADGCTIGLLNRLKNSIDRMKYKCEIVSAESVSTVLRECKNQYELDNVIKAIEITKDMYDEGKKFIKVGVSEKEIHAFFIEQAENKNVELAWHKEQCPSVKVGKDFAFGHAGPGDTKAKAGDLVHMDFGIVYNGFRSDIQRMYYLLDEGEVQPPKDVLDTFNAVRDSIVIAKESLEIGNPPFCADEEARKYVKSLGYEDWYHDIGHQVGRYIHDGGLKLAKDNEQNRKKMKGLIKKGQIFTIEPSLTSSKGSVGIEEMIYITENGAKFISKPQQEIYLIKS